MEKSISFLSYSRTDLEYVLQLYRDLKQSTAAVWLDKENIPAGDDWDKEISRGLKACACVLVVLTPASVESVHVLNEIQYAKANGKRVIPLKFADCELPFLLARSNYIDFTAGYRVGFEALLRALKLPGEREEENTVPTDNTQNETQEGEKLASLARLLAQNQVTSVFLYKRAISALQTILKNGATIKEEQRTRNILILGDGCLKNVHESVPLLSEVVSEIQQRFASIYEYEKEKFASLADELSDITKKTRLDVHHADVNLLAYSLVDKDLTTDVLKKHYGFRYPVSLFYETIAHMFKHRFIDVVINFNVDEMLDNAMDEEMETSDKKFIYSDWQFLEDKEDLMLNRRLKTPLYIKPNGTISHPGTLRFFAKRLFQIIGDRQLNIVPDRRQGRRRSTT